MQHIIVIASPPTGQITTDFLLEMGHQSEYIDSLSKANLPDYDLAIVETSQISSAVIQAIVPVIALVHTMDEINADYETLPLQDLMPDRFDNAWRNAKSRHKLYQRLQVAETAYFESEGRFNNIISASTDGILVLSTEGQVMYANPCANELFARKDIVGSNFGFPVINGDSTELELLQSNGNTVIVEMRMVETHWYGEDAYLAMLRDVTSRKLMEEMLRTTLSNNKQLIAAVDSIKIGLIVSDPTQEDMPTIYANPGFTAITGYQSDEILGRNCRFLQGPDTDPEMIDKIRHALKNRQTFKGTILNYRKDGTPFWNELLISPVFAEDGSVVNYIGLQNDVTAQREAEQALQENMMRLQGILNTAADGIMILDENGFIETVNTAAEGMFGYSAKQLSGQPLHQLIPNYFDDKSFNTTPTEDSEPDRLVSVQYHLDIVGQRQDASSFPLDLSISEVQLQGRRLYTSILHDISVRKQMQAALTASENRLSDILKSLQDVVLSVSPQSLDLLYINDAAQNMMGYTRDILLEKPQLWLDMIHEEDRTRVQQTLTNTQEKCISELNFRIMRSDDSLRWIHARIWPGYDSEGQIDRVDGIAIDITTRKATEEALVSHKEMLQSIIQSSPVGIFTMDMEGRVNLWNPACEKLFGWTQEEAQGQILPIVTENTKEEFHLLINRIRQGEAFIGYETIRHRRDGSPIEVSIGAAPMHDSQHRVTGVLAIISDNSERRRMEQERNKAERLRIALQKETELRQMRMRFMSMVSHEFRTPLTAISSSSEILERYFEKLDEERRSIHLKRIQNQVWHLIEMLEDILTITRADTLGPEFKESELDLVQICQKISAEAELNSSDSHSIVLDNDCDECIIEGDTKLLSRAINNLVSNAIKYSPLGGEIIILLKCNSHDVMLSVTDQGIGIPSVDLEHIFDAFHRADNVGTIQGTGLGLAIAHQAVELHSGQIAVNSQPGRGTTFTIRMPRQQLQ